MIGTYWSTGIMIRPHQYNNETEWGVEVEFDDLGWAEAMSITGILRCRYYEADLTTAIHTVKADAERLGIDFSDPTVYIDGDGEDPDINYPNNWREIVNAQARRLGWRESYSIEAQP